MTVGRAARRTCRSRGRGDRADGAARRLLAATAASPPPGESLTNTAISDNEINYGHCFVQLAASTPAPLITYLFHFKMTYY